MRFFLYLLRWFILSNLKEKKTGEMMSVVSIKPLHAFKTHLNFFYETCITFTTKIFFFLLLNVREQSDELLAECITSEAHANILATFNKHLQLLPLVCVQTQPCQSGVDSLRG